MKFRTKSGSVYETADKLSCVLVRMVTEGDNRNGKYKRPIGTEWITCTSVDVTLGKPAVLHRENNLPVVTNTVEEIW